MRRSRFVRQACAVALGAAIVRTAASAAGPQVRFITVASESGVAPVYAADEGMFRSAGLDVTVTQLANGGSVLPAVIGGSADFGVSNPISLATAFARGAPIACIAATVYYRKESSTSLLMVANESAIRTARDLNGKTIAVNGLRNTPQLSTQAWIDANGGDSATVKFAEISFFEMGAALLSGRVDAAFFAEPMLSEVRSRLRVLGDPYSAIAPQFITGAFFTTLTYAADHPDIVGRVAAVLRAAGAWANAHPHETAIILARVEKLDVDRVEKMARSRYAEQLRASDLQPPIDVALKYGVLKAPLAASAMIWTPPKSDAPERGGFVPNEV
jgi:NitT/TauT family transport system substrate-binding protein